MRFTQLIIELVHSIWTWNSNLIKQKHKKHLEQHDGQLIQVKPVNNEAITENNTETSIRQVADIKDEEGLKLAYDQPDGLYQHYNNLFIAGTKHYPQDHLDGLE